MQADMEKVYAEYDCIITPTSPDLAWKIGSENSQDPVKMYLTDVYTVTANLCHICAMSVPNGFAEDDGVCPSRDRSNSGRVGYRS